MGCVDTTFTPVPTHLSYLPAQAEPAVTHPGKDTLCACKVPDARNSKALHEQVHKLSRPELTRIVEWTCTAS